MSAKEYTLYWQTLDIVDFLLTFSWVELVKGFLGLVPKK